MTDYFGNKTDFDQSKIKQSFPMQIESISLIVDDNLFVGETERLEDILNGIAVVLTYGNGNVSFQLNVLPIRVERKPTDSNQLPLPLPSVTNSPCENFTPPCHDGEAQS